MNARNELTGVGLATNLLVLNGIALVVYCIYHFGASVWTYLALVLALIGAHFDGVRTERQRKEEDTSNGRQ